MEPRMRVVLSPRKLPDTSSGAWVGGNGRRTADGGRRCGMKRRMAALPGHDSANTFKTVNRNQGCPEEFAAWSHMGQDCWTSTADRPRVTSAARKGREYIRIESTGGKRMPSRNCCVLGDADALTATARIRKLQLISLSDVPANPNPLRFVTQTDGTKTLNLIEMLLDVHV